MIHVEVVIRGACDDKVKETESELAMKHSNIWDSLASWLWELYIMFSFLKGEVIWGNT